MINKDTTGMLSDTDKKNHDFKLYHAIEHLYLIMSICFLKNKNKNKIWVKSSSLIFNYIEAARHDFHNPMEPNTTIDSLNTWY